MQSLNLQIHVGKDGILKLETPIGITNADLDVILIINPIIEPRPIEWPANFFNEILGSWQGTPLIREPQGTYESRSDFQ